MKYITWFLSFEPDERYGTGPEATIAERGGNAAGIFFTNEDSSSMIVGKVNDDADLSDLDSWQVSEITPAQALALAQEINEDVVLDENDELVFPVTDLLLDNEE